MSAPKHLHRRASWARLRQAAQETLLRGTSDLDGDLDDLGTLLLCILGASGVGLAIAGAYHLYRGLF